MKLSNLEKVLYPRTGTTKGEVLNYYARIAPVMLPHLADRAVTRIRWPHGTEDMSFFEKNIPDGTPSWVHTVKVPTTGSRTASEAGRHAHLPDRRRPGDAHLAGQPGRARAARPPVDGRPQRPAAQRRPAGHRPRPGRAGRAARVLPGGAAGRATRSPSKDLDAKPVTSGSKGLHLYADLPRRLPSDESTALAKEVAEALQKEHPPLVTATMTKAKRPGKVFLDWSQNAGSKTTISPYSLRGRERP